MNSSSSSTVMMPFTPLHPSLVETHEQQLLAGGGAGDFVDAYRYLNEAKARRPACIAVMVVASYLEQSGQLALLLQGAMRCCLAWGLLLRQSEREIVEKGWAGSDDELPQPVCLCMSAGALINDAMHCIRQVRGRPNLSAYAPARQLP
jgi:hypothetical protein